MNLLKIFFQFQIMLNKAGESRKVMCADDIKTDLKQQEIKELNQWQLDHIPFTEVPFQVKLEIKNI